MTPFKKEANRTSENILGNPSFHVFSICAFKWHGFQSQTPPSGSCLVRWRQSWQLYGRRRFCDLHLIVWILLQLWFIFKLATPEVFCALFFLGGKALCAGLIPLTFSLFPFAFTTIPQEKCESWGSRMRRETYRQLPMGWVLVEKHLKDEKRLVAVIEKQRSAVLQWLWLIGKTLIHE